ncbi:MAG: metallophosphoesterase [Candidatus Loosdrechtia sp.]
MTIKDEFPIIISPNLGCPLIISVKELGHGKTISLIVAGKYGGAVIPLRNEFIGNLSLRLSYSHKGEKKTTDIPLSLKGEPEEIVEWNLLSGFKSMDETREVMNSELHYKVLGEQTRYWKLSVAIADVEDFKTLLQQKNGKYLPCLYDLVYSDRTRKWERINYHAIQFIEDFSTDCKFIHLTDLHVATRNDEILAEVVKVKNKNSRKEIEKRFINFNNNLRDFICEANRLAEEGNLHFVVITGDLVDFAFHGWEEETNPDENNWKTFINILTGREEKKDQNTTGIKVAVFTSTGNHDWRLHPYDPNLSDYNRKTLGLKKDELKNYNFKCFDSAEYPEDERARLSREITARAFERVNLDALIKTDKWKIRVEKFLTSMFGIWIMRIVPFLGVIGIGEQVRPEVLSYLSYISHAVIFGVAGLLTWGINKFIQYRTRRIVDLLVTNPLHSEATALHYYLRHINPYLDYAFRYGGHHFIVMDTGADVFIGKLLDGKEIKDLKRVSLEDNILGGAPDSRAFDSEQAYYNWSQILWLEMVVAAIPKRLENGNGMTFAFLHAPPINPPDNIDLSEVQEKKQHGREHTWIPEPKEGSRIYRSIKDIIAFLKNMLRNQGKKVLKPGEECNLTYGTINHYLSQFFYLCMGYREGDLVKLDTDRKFGLVDIVFSGHAHKNIEFRIEKDTNHKVRIFHDEYSKDFNPAKPYEWWRKSPVIVQTAACGVLGEFDENPPYYREVVIENGQVTVFRVKTVR